MRESEILVRRYGAGRAVFSAECDARYAEAAEEALGRSTRLKPYIDEDFLASQLKELGAPPQVLAQLMSTMEVEDEVFLAPKHGW